MEELLPYIQTNLNMPFTLKGSDFISTNIYDCPLFATIYSNNNRILLCIDAKTLSQDSYDAPIDKDKEYKFFPTIGIVTYDGGENYIENPRISDEVTGYKILEDNPIVIDNKVIGYKGTLTGIIEEKEIFLPNTGITADGVKMIQPDFRPGCVFVQEEIGVFMRCSVICILGIDIPIPHKYNLENGGKYSFDCMFGEQSWMEFMYGDSKPRWDYTKSLFLSGLIIDDDFNPMK